MEEILKRGTITESVNKQLSKEKLTEPRIFRGRSCYFWHKDTEGKCKGVYRRHKPNECKEKELVKEGHKENKSKSLEKALKAVSKEKERNYDSNKNSN